ncbi:MAG TPA: type III pantothenate kinase [Candidatus Eisenbacteria bacterium]|nr:type III pantothenate kinase [Candidatus Eisenbacteria bacterium]
MPEKKRKPATSSRRPRRIKGSSRILAVDIGTSETKLALMEGLDARQHWRLSSGRTTSDEARLRVESLLASAQTAAGSLAGSVVCSVAPALTLAWVRALERVAGAPPVEVGVSTVKSMPIRYHDRTAVGPDRLANAIAARDLYGTPAIVVDLGTATTFDCVSPQGAFLGGIIAPGVLTSAEELYRRAARIARVELRRPSHAVGRSTEEALQAGVIWGAAGQVDALVRRLALEMKGTPHVIATGGLAHVVAAECETINRVDETLTLKGMASIWEENR